MTGVYVPAFILLGSKTPEVFLLNPHGEVITMAISHFKLNIGVRFYRVKKDEFPNAEGG